MAGRVWHGNHCLNCHLLTSDNNNCLSRDYFKRSLLLNKCVIAGTESGYRCGLSRPRSKWVPGRTVKAFVCLTVVSSAVMAAGLYAPRGAEMVYLFINNSCLKSAMRHQSSESIC